MTFRAAVVGYGRIGSTIDDEHQNKPQFRYPGAHTPAYIEAKGVELVAASDLRPAQLEDFKPKVECYRSLYLFHGNGEARPDIVSVTTAVPNRADVVIGLSESGCVKAIYATKPISVSLAEANVMIEACHQHNVIFALACHKNGVRGFDPACRRSNKEKLANFGPWFATLAGLYHEDIATR